MNEITASCPFCGSDDLRVKPVWKTWHFVACNNCKAGGPVRKTEAEAIEAFEQRIEERRWKGAYEQQARFTDTLAKVAEDMIGVLIGWAWKFNELAGYECDDPRTYPSKEAAKYLNQLESMGIGGNGHGNH